MFAFFRAAQTVSRVESKTRSRAAPLHTEDIHIPDTRERVFSRGVLLRKLVGEKSIAAWRARVVPINEPAQNSDLNNIIIEIPEATI